MLKYAKITKYKIKKILKCFSEGLPAVKAAALMDINRKTVDRYYNLFRELIVLHSLKEMDMVSGEVELDESYF